MKAYADSHNQSAFPLHFVCSGHLTLTLEKCSLIQQDIVAIANAIWSYRSAVAEDYPDKVSANNVVPES